MVKLTVKQPIFADLRSGGERLQSGLFVPPGTDAIYLGYPYNGGPLPSRGFELVEHIADGSTDVALEAIALKCDPVLTRAEAAALKIMPKDQIAKNIGASSDCDTTYLLLGALAVAGLTLGIALITGTCGVIADPHISDLTIKNLGPGASARRLLDMRRKALIAASAKVAAR